jgi:hypothetical protein
VGSGGCYVTPLGSCDHSFIADGYGQVGADCWAETALGGLLPGEEAGCVVADSITRGHLLHVGPGQRVVLDLLVEELFFARDGRIHTAARGNGRTEVALSVLRHLPDSTDWHTDGSVVARENDTATRPQRLTLVAGSCRDEELFQGGEYQVQVQVVTRISLAPSYLPDAGRVHARSVFRVEDLRVEDLECART